MKYCEKGGSKLHKFFRKSYTFWVSIFILAIILLIFKGSYKVISYEAPVDTNQQVISETLVTKLKSIKQPITKVKQSAISSYYPCAWSNGYLSVTLDSERAISGNIEIQGTVNQIIANNYPSMEIFIDIYKGNQKIGTAFTNIDSLNSGMSWRFTAIGTHLNAIDSSDYTYEVDTISYY